MRTLTKTSFSLALLSSLVLTGCGSSSSNPSVSSASPSNNVSAGAAQDQSQPSAAVSSSKPDSGCLAGGPDVAKGETKGMKWEINPEGWRKLLLIEGAGPCSTAKDGLKTGYARTPAGALAAVVNYDAQIHENFPDKDTPSRLRSALAKGPDTDTLVKKIEEDVKNGSVGDASEESTEKAIKLTKYQIVSADENNVRIRLAASVPGSNMEPIVTANLKWEDNDWKMVPATASQVISVEESGDTSGFTGLPQG